MVLLNSQPARRAAGELRTVLAAVEVGRAEGRHQVLEHDHRFAVGEIADDGADPLAGTPSSRALMAPKASRQPAGCSLPSFLTIGVSRRRYFRPS